MASISRLNDLKQKIRLEYTYPDETPMIHIVKQCPRRYYLAQVVRKDWPFLKKFNRFYQYIEEAGLNMKWYDLVDYSLIAEKLINTPMIRAPKLQPFSLYDLQVAFYIYFLGLILCFSTFLFEKWTKICL